MVSQRKAAQVAGTPSRSISRDVGGKLESMYFAFGDVDCFVIVDLPDNVSAAALSLAVNESGLIASKAIVLLTPEEMDQAGKTKVHFRAPAKKLRPDALPTRRRFVLWRPRSKRP